MNSIHLIMTALSLLFCFHPAAGKTAEEATRDRVLEPGNAIQGKPYPAYHPDSESERTWDHALPFLGQRALDRGFSLPLPYGVSLIFFHQNQGFSIESMEVAFRKDVPYKNIDFIDFSGAKVDNTSWQTKLDAWIFPFLNAFVTLGSVKGTGTVPISIAKADLYDFFTPNLCSGGSPPAFCEGYFSAVAPIDYNGYNYGLGLLLASGYKDWFFAAPITYVITNVNVSEDNITAFSFIPRVGYNYRTPRSGKFGFYAGANYLNTKVNLTGHYELPLAGDPNVGENVTVRYRMSQQPLDVWNALAGINWELSSEWSAVLEVGFSENKENQTLNVNYRF